MTRIKLSQADIADTYLDELQIAVASLRKARRHLQSIPYIECAESDEADTHLEHLELLIDDIKETK